PVDAMDVGMFLEMPADRIDGHQRGGVAVIRLDLKEDVGVTRYWGDEETVPPGRSKHHVIAAPGVDSGWPGPRDDVVGAGAAVDRRRAGAAGEHVRYDVEAQRRVGVMVGAVQPHNRVRD